MEEIWKPITGYEGYYEISNFGNIKSLDRILQQGDHSIIKKGTQKKFYISKKGYPVVTLCKNGKRVGKYLHILLAKTFIPNPENKPYVDHINTNKIDYRLENLRWVTAKENSNNSLTKQHLKNDANNKRGIIKRLLSRKNGNSKTKPKTVYQLDENKLLIRKYFSIAEAARNIQVSPSYLRKKLNAEKLKGFFWSDKYEES